MKIIKRISLVIVLLVLIFVSYKYVIFKKYSVENGDTEKEITKVLTKNESPIYLKDAFSFEWTDAYVFQAYTPSESIEKKVKVKWIPQKSFLGYLFDITDFSLQDDGRMEMIFVNEDKVVKDIVFYSREFNIKQEHLKRNDTLILKDKEDHIYSIAKDSKD
ncbi:hypothetical protein QR721_11250 [Aciduricibacillus chroicocephali]|uniref:DUF4825 domain-containing protein n=1 Tax=Aciduricibacillus chroicocephali TaxID=3054939 RepID=A0ABY9KTV5_9BACI|nr:hypothetical protein QR721_11250 [Bacillaceae bacterium 44XB]